MNTKTEYYSQKRWLIVLLGIGILISGVIIGGSGMFLWMKYRKEHLQPPAEHAQKVARCIHNELDLTEEQTNKVKAVLEKHFNALYGIEEDMITKCETEREKLQIEFKKVLSTEQYDKWKKKFEAMRKRFRYSRR